MYSFEYDYQGPDEDDTASATRTIHEDATLPEVLAAFREFIRSAGFDYVFDIQALKDDGEIVSSHACTY